MLSENLVSIGKCLPIEFARKSRPVAEVDRWKAVELRTFLLYTGPLALKGVLGDEVFEHFMLVSVAFSILVLPAHCIVYNDYANQLLVKFVMQARQLYGSTFIVCNVHSLVHVTQDVKARGYLDSFSAFPFENQMCALKRMVRKGALPLSQIVRQITEKRSLTVNATHLLRHIYGKHFNGPVPDGFEQWEQFSRFRDRGFCLSLTGYDNFVAVDGLGPMKVRNILKPEDCVYLVGNMCKSV